MKEVMSFLALLVILAALAFAVPLALGIYETWTASTTSSVVTGVFAICGGAVALGALGFGIAAGAGLARDRREQRGDARPMTVYQPPAQDDLGYWRTEKARADAQRAQAALAREQQALLPQPQQQAQPAQPWAGDWLLIDDTAEANDPQSPRPTPSPWGWG